MTDVTICHNVLLNFEGSTRASRLSSKAKRTSLRGQVQLLQWESCVKEHQGRHAWQRHNRGVRLGLTPERSGKVGKAHAALPPPSHSREHPRAAKTQKQPPASFHVVESRFVDNPSRLSVRLAFCSFTSEEESQCCRRRRRRRRFKEARGGKALSGKLH